MSGQLLMRTKFKKGFHMSNVRFLRNILAIAFGVVLACAATPAEASHKKSKRHHKHSHHSKHHHHSHHHHKHHSDSDRSGRTDNERESLDDLMYKVI